MIRSDSGFTHRLSLSARVVSTLDSQVKTKRQWQKRLWRMGNRDVLTIHRRTREAIFGGLATLTDSYFYPGNISIIPADPSS